MATLVYISYTFSFPVVPGVEAGPFSEIARQYTS
jgi:hypothetical protein